MSITKFSTSLTSVLAPTTYTVLSLPVYKRTASGSIIVSMSGSGAVRIFSNRDDFSATWNLNYEYKNNAFDENLSSYAHYLVPPATGETDALTVDFNTVADRIILIGLFGGNTTVYHRLYGSPDGNTWNLLLTSNVTSATAYTLRSTFRYLKITVQNTSTSASHSSCICELAAFPIAGAVYARSITYEDKVVFGEIQTNRYYITVEPSPSLTIAVFERAPPSSGSEVWVL